MESFVKIAFIEKHLEITVSGEKDNKIGKIIYYSENFQPYDS